MGSSVRGSSTSASIPSAARLSAAARASCTIRDQATIVRSLPARLTSACPSGIRYSSSGTGPFLAYRSSCSTKSTGSLLRIDVLSSPLASCGVLGTTTRIPGALTNQDSMECECCAPFCVPPPPGARIVSGTSNCPPNIARVLATWLTIWSMATIAKFMVMSSGTGRRPARAAPSARPTMPASAIGVSRTRRDENSAISPSVARNVPPKRPMSSPMRKTFSSRRISSAIASISAS